MDGRAALVFLRLELGSLINYLPDHPLAMYSFLMCNIGGWQMDLGCCTLILAIKSRDWGSDMQLCVPYMAAGYFIRFGCI